MVCPPLSVVRFRVFRVFLLSGSVFPVAVPRGVLNSRARQSLALPGSGAGFISVFVSGLEELANLVRIARQMQNRMQDHGLGFDGVEDAKRKA